MSMFKQTNKRTKKFLLALIHCLMSLSKTKGLWTQGQALGEADVETHTEKPARRQRQTLQ